MHRAIGPRHAEVGGFRVPEPVDRRGAPRVRVGLVELPGENAARAGRVPSARLDGVAQAVVVQLLARPPEQVDPVEPTAETALHEGGVVPPRPEVLVDGVGAVSRPAMLGRDEALEAAGVGHPLDTELAVQQARPGVVQLVLGAKALVLPRTVHVVLALRVGAHEVEPVEKARAGRRGRQERPPGVARRDGAGEDADHRRRLVEGDVVAVRGATGKLVAPAPDRQAGVEPALGHDH
jgi:hypothetical protein